MSAMTNQVIQRIVFVLIGVSTILVGPLLTNSSVGKLCCDQNCKQPIGYGRTNTRYISEYSDHLSFPKSAIVTVYAKGIWGDEGQELWEGQILGKRGLLAKESVNELNLLCEPKIFVEMKPPEGAEPKTEMDEPKTEMVDGIGLETPRREEASEGVHPSPDEQARDFYGSDTTSMEETKIEPSSSIYDEYATGSEWPKVEPTSFIHDKQLNIDAKEERAFEEQQLDSDVAQGAQTETESASGELGAKLKEDKAGVSPEWHTGTPDKQAEGDHLNEYKEKEGGAAKTEDWPGDWEGKAADGEAQTTSESLKEKLPDSETGGKVEQEIDLLKEQAVDEAKPDREDVEEDLPRSEIFETPTETPPFTSESPPEPALHEHVMADQSEPPVSQVGASEQTSETDDVEESYAETEFTGTVTMRSGHRATVTVRSDGTAEIKEDQGDVYDVDYTDLYNAVEDQTFLMQMNNWIYNFLEEDDDDDDYDDDDLEEPDPVHDYATPTPESRSEIPDSVPKFHSQHQATHEQYSAGEYLNVDAVRERMQQVQQPPQEHLPESHSTTFPDSYPSETRPPTPTPEKEIHSEEGLPGFVGSEGEPLTPDTWSEGEHTGREEEFHTTETLWPSEETIVARETPVYTEEPDAQQFDDDEGRLGEEEEPPQKQEEPEWTPPPLVSPSQGEESDGATPLPDLEFLTHDETFEDLWEYQDEYSHATGQPGKGGYEDVVKYYLPASLAEWLLDQSPGTMLVSILSTVLSLLLPLWFSSCCRERTKSRMLKEHGATLHMLKEDLRKLQEEKEAIEAAERKTATEVREMKLTITGLSSTKAELEAHLQSLSNSLTATQQEVVQYQAHTEQLNKRLAHEQAQLSAQIAEKDVLMQQMSELTLQLQEMDQHIKELTSSKEQLENDISAVQQQQEDLQNKHERMARDCEEAKKRCTVLERQLAVAQEEAGSLRETLREKEEEVGTLQRCLNELTEGYSSGETSGEGEVSAETTDGGDRTQAQLTKIRAMLDTTKAQTELRGVREKKDALEQELQEKSQLANQVQATNLELQERVATLERANGEAEDQYKAIEMKFNTLTTYFESKQESLQKRLGVEEASRQAFQQREAGAKEREQAIELERAREKEELQKLRREMTETERSLRNQVATNEKRAEDALSQLHRMEQDLRAAHKEVTMLKRKIADLDHLPPGLVKPVPYHAPRPHSQPPRPVSGPRLPRTSSPTREGVGSQQLSANASQSQQQQLRANTSQSQQQLSANTSQQQLRANTSLQQLRANTSQQQLRANTSQSQQQLRANSSQSQQQLRANTSQQQLSANTLQQQKAETPVQVPPHDIRQPQQPRQLPATGRITPTYHQPPVAPQYYGGPPLRLPRPPMHHEGLVHPHMPPMHYPRPMHGPGYGPPPPPPHMFPPPRPHMPPPPGPRYPGPFLANPQGPRPSALSPSDSAPSRNIDSQGQENV